MSLNFSYIWIDPGLVEIHFKYELQGNLDFTFFTWPEEKKSKIRKTQEAG